MRCKAITKKGDRCTKDVVKDGYCLQHWKIRHECQKGGKVCTRSKRSKSKSKSSSKKTFKSIQKAYNKTISDDPLVINPNVEDLNNKFYFPAGEYYIGDPVILSPSQYEELEENRKYRGEDEVFTLFDVENYGFVDGKTVVGFHFQDNGPFIYMEYKDIKESPVIDSGELIMTSSSVVEKLSNHLSAKKIRLSSPFTIVQKIIPLPGFPKEEPVFRYYFVNSSGKVLMFVDT